MMWEWKSKRNGKVHILNDEEHEAMKKSAFFPFKNFIITELKLREIIPMRVAENIKPKKKKE